MTAAQPDLFTEGQRRRDREIEGHRERYEILLEEIDRRLRNLSKTRARLDDDNEGVVSADDAHWILDQMLEEPGWEGPDVPDRRAFGGLWQSDGWTKVGYAQSQRPENNARPISQFKWTGG